MRDQTDCSLNHRCTPGQLYLMSACVCARACACSVLVFFQRCYCTVFSSSINHSVQLAQFSLNFLLSGKSSAPTAQTPVWPTTQTPRQAPPPPSTPPRMHPCTDTTERRRRADGSAAGACARVTCLFFFFRFFPSFHQLSAPLRFLRGQATPLPLPASSAICLP